MSRKIKISNYASHYNILSLDETSEKFKVLIAEIEKSKFKISMIGNYSEQFYIVIRVYSKKSWAPLMRWKLAFKYRITLSGDKKEILTSYCELIDPISKENMEKMNSQLQSMGYDIKFSNSMNRAAFWPKY